jgi:hypothetical protein
MDLQYFIFSIHITYKIPLSLYKKIASWFVSLENQSEAHEARADFLASRALLARGQTTRGIRFSESSLVELDTGRAVFFEKEYSAATGRTTSFDISMD